MRNNANILQVLMSLFNEYDFLLGEEQLPKLKKVTSEFEIKQQLQQAGLTSNELEFTLKWLEEFTQFSDFVEINYMQDTIRVFSKNEKIMIPLKYRKALVEYKLNDELSTVEFEFILQQMIALNHPGINEDQFMWIYDMTVANRRESTQNNHEHESMNNDQIISIQLH